MPKTREFLKFSNLSQSLLYAFIKTLASNMSGLCYFFMVMSQIVSGGLISILYPFAVFGYALMEEGRPGKHFWEFMIKYSLVILFLKFIFQLDFWLSFDGLSDSYTNINVLSMTICFIFSLFIELGLVWIMAIEYHS